jgi:GTP cyclohydrolase I
METERPDAQAARDAVRTLLAYIGEDPDRDGLKDTPRRFVKALGEMTKGYTQEPLEILATRFQCYSDELVIVRDIEFSSMCEHHLLPFIGRAHVAYLPAGDQVLGLSKVARLVDAHAKRLQIQEKMTADIARDLYEVSPDVAVQVIAHHSCMSVRGVGKAAARMVTTALKGRFKTDAELRGEVLASWA